MIHNPRLKHSIYKWKTQSKITSNATVSLLQLYFISVADTQTTHYGFTDIIFHILLAVSFLHSRFLFYPPLTLAGNTWCFGISAIRLYKLHSRPFYPVCERG